MRYTIENGGFSKRGSANIPALEFSPQMWLVNFDSGDTESVRKEKTQRGVRAVFKLVAAEIPLNYHHSGLNSRFHTTCSGGQP